MMNSYSAKDIVSLSAGRAYREKIGMYLSANRQEAINLGLRELIVNVQDEYEVYKPKNPELRIDLNTNNKIITVIDNMRGIPVGERVDGINSLTATFLIPHSGGKHTEGVYSSAIGINGEGNKIVCHTAKWLEVEVKRDRKVYFQRFESTKEGASAVTGIIEKEGNEDTGTKITYMPDPQVYGDCFIDIDALRKMLTEISYFTIGLKIILIIDGKEETFLSRHGLIDGLISKNRISEPFSYFYETDDCKVELALQWVSKSGEIRGYANGLYMKDGGDFITAFRRSLTSTVNRLAGTKFSGESIRHCLNGFVSVKVKIGQFSNQAKTALANKEAAAPTSIAISEALKKFSIEHREDFSKVIDLLNKLEKAEAAAERARKQIFETSKEIEKNASKKVFNSDKLKDAEFLGPDATLLIVEGNSASGSMTNARDYTKYGILAIRGKIINCLANTEERIADNEEIKLLLKALNIVPGKYNASKLRYGRVAICSDADSDGYHIGLLIMATLRYLAPQFLNEGRLYWLRSPLYIVSNGKQESYYYDDDEFNAVRGSIKGSVTRCKGLGTLSADQAHNSMFTSQFQRMDKLEPTAESITLLEQLMGESPYYRTKFLFENVDFTTLHE